MSRAWMIPCAWFLTLACVADDELEFRSDQLGNAELGDLDKAEDDQLEGGEADEGGDSDKTYVRELIDGGDAPFVAGCVGRSHDPECGKIVFTLGDYCLSETILWEETYDTKCREFDSASDDWHVLHDCDALCRATGQPGRCKKFPDTCAKFADNEPFSAACECYKDPARHSDIDGGNEPAKPGCHYDWDDDACSKNRTLISGDACANEVLLHEWALNDCHMGGDTQIVIDCNAWCEAKHNEHWRGTCMAVPDACGGAGSAVCDCQPEI
jgi:hypothetical protein